MQTFKWKIINFQNSEKKNPKINLHTLLYNYFTYKNKTGWFIKINRTTSAIKCLKILFLKNAINKLAENGLFNTVITTNMCVNGRDCHPPLLEIVTSKHSILWRIWNGWSGEVPEEIQYYVWSCDSWETSLT